VSSKFGLLVGLSGSASVSLPAVLQEAVMTQITTNELRAKWAGKDRWLSDGGSRGAGHLVARIKRNGVFFYFQYIGPDGRKRLFPLGVFDVHGKRGLSLAAARERSAELSALYRKGTIDIHAHFELHEPKLHASSRQLKRNCVRRKRP
jgi:hypothetical protein